MATKRKTQDRMDIASECARRKLLLSEAIESARLNAVMWQLGTHYHVASPRLAVQCITVGDRVGAYAIIQLMASIDKLKAYSRSISYTPSDTWKALKEIRDQLVHPAGRLGMHGKTKQYSWDGSVIDPMVYYKSALDVTTFIQDNFAKYRDSGLEQLGYDILECAKEADEYIDEVYRDAMGTALDMANAMNVDMSLRTAFDWCEGRMRQYEEIAKRLPWESIREQFDKVRDASEE